MGGSTSQNDGGQLPEYTGKMVVECPVKWGWGAPVEEQRRLNALLEGLEKLRHAGVTTATVAVAFHKRSLLPLAQRNVFMWEMTRGTPWVGARILETPVPASEITTRVSRNTHSDLKGFSGGVDAPRERLHFSGKTPLLSLILCLFPFILALALIVARLQGMGIIKDSLPPVSEDKELRAKNQARNEEQKKAKEAKKAKSARKAQRRETADKNRREAEKAGLRTLESPDTSVSEIEGGGDTHWLNELADEEEEDEVIPLSARGSRSQSGRGPEGGRRSPRGLKHRGRENRPLYYC